MATMQSYRALRVLLLILTIIEALAGIFLILTSGWMVNVAPAGFHLGSSILILMLLKVVGVLGLTLAWLTYSAYRDPVRYVAVVDALAFLLLAAAAVDVYGLLALHIAPFYPAQYVLIRVIVRVILAIVLISLRPREHLTA